MAKEQTINPGISAALERARSRTPQCRNPYFVKSIRKSDLCKSQMYLPKPFSDEHLPKDQCVPFALEDEQGLSYNVQYNGQCRFMLEGWSKFGKEHELAVGDVVLFELTAPGTFKVQIFRVLDQDVPNEIFLGKKRSVDGQGAGCLTRSRKNKVTEENQPADTNIANIGTKRKKVKRTQGSGEVESLTRTREPEVDLESLEHYKSKCYELSVQLEKKKLECTILHGKLVEVETKKNVSTDDTQRAPEVDATECWRKMFSDLESRFLRFENENLAMGCVESRMSSLERRVLRIENENLAMGCVESRVSSLESLVLSMENEMVGNNWNRNRAGVIKWESEDDMLSSFEENLKLCMKAVCALYKQIISEDEVSAKGLFIPSDVVRVTTLAKFLMDDDCKGDLKKSVKELEIFDSEAVEDCKKLARRYSWQLFSAYQNGKDPFFLPATSDSHGDQTAK